MQHQQAVQDHLVEQYLLNEMDEPARDAFEEHFFDCHECATELKVTSAFLDATRLELKRQHAAEAAPVESVRSAVIQFEPKRSWLQIFTPTFAFGALAACLLLIAYQNVVVYPRLSSQVARLEAPELTPSLSLAGAASRGGGTPSASLGGAHSLILLVDIPTKPGFTSYICQLYSPAHQLISTIPVSAAQARDTVSIRFPMPTHADGQYSLVVQGVSPTSGSGTQVAQYSFHVNTGSNSSNL
jgi:hypothetical protein